MAPKLGIVAGGGELPGLLIRGCRKHERPVHIIALGGQADPGVIAGSPHDWIRLGAAAEAFARLKAAGALEVVFAGKIHRPKLRELMPDWRTAGFLARIGGRLLSDNRLVDAIIEEFESEGFRVVGPGDVLPELLARAGSYGCLSPTPEEERSIAVGMAAARENGLKDMGQAAVVQGGKVLAVEGPEGTDALIVAAQALQEGATGAILVKARKPQQQMRADPPVIGPTTVARAAAARYRGIAVEVGGVLVLEQEALVQAIDGAGMFLAGVSPAP